MADGPTKGRPAIHRDLDMIFAETEALRELASDPDKAQDGARVYDFSIKWETLMSGRLKRLEHYHRTGETSRRSRSGATGGSETNSRTRYR